MSISGKSPEYRELSDDKYNKNYDKIFNNKYDDKTHNINKNTESLEKPKNSNKYGNLKKINNKKINNNSMYKSNE